MKTLKVTCDTKLRIPLDELHELQGELKEMSTDRYAKFRKLVLKHGIWFAMHVWGGRAKLGDKFGKLSDGKWYIEDGHGRKRMFTEMRDKEKYGIPDLPCVEIFAKDMEEAKQAIMAASSRFQKITGDGLSAFATDAGFTVEELADDYELADVDMDKWKDEYHNEGALLPELGGDKAPFQQMAFVLHESQVELVKRALDKAKAQGPFQGANENGNGNALTRICEGYLGRS